VKWDAQRIAKSSTRKKLHARIIERCSFMIRRDDVGGCAVVGRPAVSSGRKGPRAGD
jgi:hypothetical protein